MLAVALVIRRELRLVPRFRPILGAVVIVAIVGGWYALAAGLGGDSFVRKQILKENVFRFVGVTKMRSGHSHPFYYYFPTLLAGLVPWTPFVLAALVAARAAARRRDATCASPFPLVWFAVVFVFYSLADAKRSVYLLALYPAAALIAGWWWSEVVRGTEPARWLRERMGAHRRRRALLPSRSSRSSRPSPKDSGFRPWHSSPPARSQGSRQPAPRARHHRYAPAGSCSSGPTAMVGALAVSVAGDAHGTRPSTC